MNNTAEGNLQNDTETAAQKKKRIAAEKNAASLEAEALLEKQKQELEAEKDKDKNKKKDKPKTLKDLTKDYNLKKRDGLFIPGLFHRKKRYMDLTEEKVDIYHAMNFLLGTEIFAEQGSCSAKFTYIGPNRKYTIKQVRIAKRELRPKHGNWKIFYARIIMFKGEEHSAKIKDTQVIRSFITSQGGIKNVKIRFVQDKEFIQKEAKKKAFVKDPVRYRNMKYNMKRDQAKLGVKPVLRNKEEAMLLINDLKLVTDRKVNFDHVIKYLLNEVKKYDTIEKEKKAEAKKD